MALARAFPTNLFLCRFLPLLALDVYFLFLDSEIPRMFAPGRYANSLPCAFFPSFGPIMTACSPHDELTFSTFFRPLDQLKGTWLPCSFSRFLSLFQWRLAPFPLPFSDCSRVSIIFFPIPTPRKKVYLLKIFLSSSFFSGFSPS